MFGLSVATRSGGTSRLDFPERAFVLLGRAAHCDVVLRGEGVLEEHARLERSAGVVRVVALDAARPVTVNGRSVAQAVVAEGDHLTIGECEIELCAPRPRSRLAALGAFAPWPEPLEAAGSGRRISLEDLEELEPCELPDVGREARTLRRILEINKRLARAADEDTLLDAFLDAANGLVGSERAMLLARSEQGGVVVLRSRDLSGAPVPRPEDALDRAVALAVLEAGRPAATDRLAPGAAVCVPLPGSAPLALYLDGSGDDGRFSPDDARLLESYGEQVALALERVRLLADNQRQQAELSRAAEQAERLNRRLAELLERRTAELRDARDDLALADDGFRKRYPDIVGRGPAMVALLRQVDRVADTNVPVLFEGESGTGKELLARALHASSSRSALRFVAENCAALPDTLLENELFGHERGAFTGADAAAAGLFERADGGTLFLDEVGDMSPSLQKRLLRVLQEHEVRRVGGSEVRKVDVRVVAATNSDLRALVEAGRFREDLFYRLAVVRIRVPPLRERREDVPALVDHFLRRTERGAEPLRISDAAMDALVRHPWPGNVRQLENELRRAAALSRGVVDLDGLSAEVREGRGGGPTEGGDPAAELAGRDLRALVEELEVRVVRAVLDRERWNITHAARALGLSRLGLRKKVQRYGLSRESRERSPSA